jgi:hypothetical protein
MAKTKATQEYAAQLVTRDTEVEFEGRCLQLKGWGSVDKQALLKPNCYLILEAEEGQKHPCTNVLKLWPYLEAEPEKSVILVHVFFQGGKRRDSSRGRLGPFVGQKMADALNGRFRYCQLVIDRNADRIVEGLDDLRQSLLLWKSD